MSKDETHQLRTYLGDLRSIEGSVDANTELRSPDGDFTVPVHFGINKVAVPGSDRAFSIPATGNAPSRTFHKPGNAQIAVGDLTMKLVGRKANGQSLGPVDVACKLNTHPQPVVASFQITEPGKTTGTPPSGTPGAGAGTGTGATTGSASTGASGVSASTDNGTVGGTTANTGQDTRDPMLLAAGALVAGGGIFLLGSRLKRRRSE